jgi:hypothetical protein
MLPVEESEIKAIEETKKAYIQTIAQLEEKLQDLNTIQDKDILESEEFRSMVKVIEEEIDGLKSEYNDYVAIVHKMTQITSANEEEMEVSSTPEPSDAFRVDDRVVCDDDCEGTVIGLEDGGNNIVVLCDNGTTKTCTGDTLKKVEASNEDHAALGAETETSTTSFTPDDKVENKDERYGTVQGVNDVTGAITVVFDDGETCECNPEDLIIVKEKGVDKNTNKTIIEIDEKYYRPAEVDILIGDNTKAKKVLNWSPTVKFLELVKIMMEYDKKNV